MTMEHRFSPKAREIIERYKRDGHLLKVAVESKAWVVRIFKLGRTDPSNVASGTGGTAEEAFWTAYYVFGMNTGEW